MLKKIGVALVAVIVAFVVVVTGLSLGVGLRYWYLKAREGTTDFTNFSNGETPIVDFYTVRTGVTVSLRRTW